MDTTDLFFVVLILSVASFIQSATGFGNALLCLATLPLIIPVEEGIALITVFNLAIASAILLFNRDGFSIKKAMPLIIGGVIGIPIGFYGLKVIDGALIIRVLGVVLIMISLNELLKGRILPLIHLPEKAGIPMGMLSGILGGAFNVGGPPIVVYAYSRGWGKAQSVAVMQSVFIVMGFIRLGLMVGAGDCSPRLFHMTLWATLPAFGAIWLGKKALDHFPQQLLKQIVFTMILGMGIWYVISG